METPGLGLCGRNNGSLHSVRRIKGMGHAVILGESVTPCVQACIIGCVGSISIGAMTALHLCCALCHG